MDAAGLASGGEIAPSGSGAGSQSVAPTLADASPGMSDKVLWLKFLALHNNTLKKQIDCAFLHVHMPRWHLQMVWLPHRMVSCQDYDPQ